MRRTSIFLILLLSGVASFTIIAVVSAVLLPQTPYWGMGGMMGGGGMGGSAQTSPYLTLFWLLSSAAVLVSLLGAGGLVYLFFNPETGKAKTDVETRVEEIPRPADATPQGGGDDKDADAALKFLKPEEKQVITILRAHGGTYLQKWIAADTGLSRLQTHRILARLSDRKMVTLKKSGNTNEVSLAPALMGRGGEDEA